MQNDENKNKAVQMPAPAPKLDAKTSTKPMSSTWATPGAGSGAKASPAKLDPDFMPLPKGQPVEMTARQPPIVETAIKAKIPTRALQPINNASSESDMPAMPNPPCSKDNPSAWPGDWYPIKQHTIGFLRMKVFPGVKCSACKRSHPTAFCGQCKNLFEVWTYKVARGKCTNRDCKKPDSHDTAACGYGEFRDHPDNKTPGELKDFVRPWPADALKQPLPIYYRKGIGEPPHPSLPRLPSRWEAGIPCGMWDRKEGLHFSAVRTIAIADGKELPKYDPKNFLTDKQLGLVAADKAAPKTGRNLNSRKPAAGQPRQNDRHQDRFMNNWLDNVQVPPSLPRTGLRREEPMWFERTFEGAVTIWMNDADYEVYCYLRDSWQAVFDSYEATPAGRKRDWLKKSAIKIRLWAVYVVKTYVKWLSTGPEEKDTLPRELLAELERVRRSVAADRVNIDYDVTQTKVKTLAASDPDEPPSPPRKSTAIAVERYVWVESTCGLTPSPKFEQTPAERVQNLPPDADGDDEEGLTDCDRRHPSFEPKTTEQARAHLVEWIDWASQSLTQEKGQAFLSWFREAAGNARTSVAWNTRPDNRDRFNREWDDTMKLFRDEVERLLTRLRPIVTDASTAVGDTNLTLEHFARLRTRIENAFKDFHHCISTRVQSFGARGKSDLIDHLYAISEHPGTSQVKSDQEIAELSCNRLKGSALPAECPVYCVLKRLAWPRDFVSHWQTLSGHSQTGSRRLQELFANEKYIPRS
jgi:hypothetical protein